jgi:hypothetical protein
VNGPTGLCEIPGGITLSIFRGWTAVTKFIYEPSLGEFCAKGGSGYPGRISLYARSGSLLALTALPSSGPEVHFGVHVRNDNRERTPPLVRLKSLCGTSDGGEPVLTVLLPEED